MLAAAPLRRAQPGAPVMPRAGQAVTASCHRRLPPPWASAGRRSGSRSSRARASRINSSTANGQRASRASGTQIGSDSRVKRTANSATVAIAQARCRCRWRTFIAVQLLFRPARRSEGRAATPGPGTSWERRWRSLPDAPRAAGQASAADAPCSPTGVQTVQGPCKVSVASQTPAAAAGAPQRGQGVA